MSQSQVTFKKLLAKAGWAYSLAEPTQNIATALKLKATAKSLRIFQSLVENDKTGK
ncbi:MAG: hypothetical protein HGB14_05385 [Anaerolineaceae bacterium]|nr:hypothetical protein [Anaerolineaceae bacterium]